MKSWSQLIFMSFFLFFLCCTQEEKKKVNIPITTNPSLQLDLLVFNLEQKIELWSSQNKQKKLLTSFKIQNQKDWRIGKYQIKNLANSIELQDLEKKSSKTLHPALSYPIPSKLIISPASKTATTIQLSQEDFEELQAKLAQVKNATALVLPNDNRKGVTFQPCYGCAHWMAEVYAQLELEIKAYHQ